MQTKIISNVGFFGDIVISSQRRSGIQPTHAVAHLGLQLNLSYGLKAMRWLHGAVHKVFIATFGTFDPTPLISTHITHIATATWYSRGHAVLS